MFVFKTFTHFNCQARKFYTHPVCLQIPCCLQILLIKDFEQSAYDVTDATENSMMTKVTERLYRPSFFASAFSLFLYKSILSCLVITLQQSQYIFLLLQRKGGGYARRVIEARIYEHFTYSGENDIRLKMIKRTRGNDNCH